MSDSLWSAFLNEDPESPIAYFTEIATFFELHPTTDFPEKSAVISQIFSRIDIAITTLPFSEIGCLIISVLSSLASIAPLSHFMAKGLLESVVVLFLNTTSTFEESVRFLDRFFARADADSILEDVVFVMIVNFVNFAPPKPPFWKFLCHFLTRFGATIELMCDLRATDAQGMLPIFTRSLIWTYRIVYQNPPEIDEPCFWELWDSVLTRYRHDIQFFEGSPVILMFKGIFTEIRLSLYWALQWTESSLSRNVWKCLYEISPDEMIEFLEEQEKGPALEAACIATLSFASEEKAIRLRLICELLH
jgi:hypothetical protein